MNTQERIAQLRRELAEQRRRYARLFRELQAATGCPTTDNLRSDEYGREDTA